MSVKLITIAVCLVMAHCVYSGPVATKFLAAITDTPADDLINDPCFNQAYNDTIKCAYAKIPDLDPTDNTPKYYCCLTWVELDCMKEVAKSKCTAAEATTLAGLEDKVIVWANDNFCKDHHYTKGIKTCKK